MPTRRNLGERLVSLDDDEINEEADGWSWGMCWGVCIRPNNGSNEQIPCGVIVRVDGPGAPDYLYDFASLGALTATMGKLRVQHLEEFLTRAKYALDQRDEESPAPAVVIYGTKTPWRYPSAMVALDRMWQSHVSPLLKEAPGPAEQSPAAGQKRA